MSDEPLYVKFSSLDDLVRLVAFSATPFLQHAEVEGKHVYFYHSMLFGGRPMVYFTLRRERIDKKYVVYNRFNDSLSFSDKLETDGQSVYIPILEVESTNLLGFILSKV